MTNFKPDVGGNFASDEHRRVMAQVNNDDVGRVPFDLVVERVNADDQVDLTQEEVAGILQDLVTYGDVDLTEEGYDSTDMGSEALEGKIAEDGGRKHE